MLLKSPAYLSRNTYFLKRFLHLGTYRRRGFQKAGFRPFLVSVNGSYKQGAFMDEKLKEDLMKWIMDCRDQVLYGLAHREDELGRIAEGLGQDSVSLINRLSTKD